VVANKSHSLPHPFIAEQTGLYMTLKEAPMNNVRLAVTLLVLPPAKKKAINVYRSLYVSSAIVQEALLQLAVSLQWLDNGLHSCFHLLPD
jgi:rhodanese-related sulfurtransferase